MPTPRRLIYVFHGPDLTCSGRLPLKLALRAMIVLPLKRVSASDCDTSVKLETDEGLEWEKRRKALNPCGASFLANLVKAGDRTRTGDPQLGNLPRASVSNCALPRTSLKT